MRVLILSKNATAVLQPTWQNSLVDIEPPKAYWVNSAGALITELMRIEYHTVLCTATRFSLFCRRKKLESADFELRWEQLNILSQLKQECQSESVRHPELPLESGYVCSNFISRIVQWRAWVIRPLMNWPIHKRGCVDRDRYDAMHICPICGFYFLHRRKRWRMIESRPERRDTGSVDYFELLNHVLAGNWNLP